MSKVLSGGCLCGYIRFTAANPGNPHTCSCDICQKHTGGQTVVWLEFSRENVDWVGEGGMPSVYRSSDVSSRAFCPRCGSSLGAIDDGPNVALLTGTIDPTRENSFIPEFHSFQDLKPEWWKCILPNADS